MPCIRNDNGRVVPGEKGTCPTGSTWSDTADNNQFEWDDVSTWAKRRYFDEEGDIRPVTTAIDLGTAALVANPIGAGVRGAMFAGSKGIPWLMGRMFGKKVAAQPAKLKEGVKFTQANNLNSYRLPKPTTTQVPKYPINATNAGRTIVTPNRSVLAPSSAKGNLAQLMNKATPAGRAFSPLRTAAVVGAGAQGVDYVAPFTDVGKENKRLRDERAAELKTQTQNRDDEVQNAANIAADQAKAERDRVAGLGFFDRMKEPGYWDTSISGFKGDDRLNRLGQLLYFYGLPPSGRAKAKNPAETWAKMSADAATLASKNAGDSAFSKVGDKTLVGSISKKVEDDYGNTWLPGDVMFGGKLGKKDLESVTQRIAVLINQISRQPGMSNKTLDYLYEEAKRIYELERNA